MRIYYLLFFYYVLFNADSVFPQASLIQWQKSVGAEGDDIAYSIVETDDGGYICGGNSNSNNAPFNNNHGDRDICIIKFDSLGTVQWQKLYGGSGYDFLSEIKQSYDGGFVFCGYTTSDDGDISINNGSFDCWVVKLDSTGNIVWEKTYGGSDFDQALSILLMSDSGYVFAGVTHSNNGDVTGPHGGYDGWVVKLDQYGSIQWQRPFGGSDDDAINSIVPCSDKGFVFAGSSSSDNYNLTVNKGQNDYWIVKLDSMGFIQWVKSYGGSGIDFATSVIKTSGDQYVIEGGTYSNDGDVTGNHGDMDIWIIKLESSGSINWEKTLGGSDRDYPGRIQNAYNGYLVASYAYSTDGDISVNYGGYGDCWIVQLDTSGNIMFEKNFGGSRQDRLISLQQTNDGGVIFSGWSDSNDQDLTANQGNFDMWVVKLYSLPIAIDEIKLKESKMEIYPNPCYSFCNIRCDEFSESMLTVYDVTRRRVKTLAFNNAVTLNISDLLAGLYILELKDSSLGIRISRMLKY